MVLSVTTTVPLFETYRNAKYYNLATRRPKLAHAKFGNRGRGRLLPDTAKLVDLVRLMVNPHWFFGTKDRKLALPLRITALRAGEVGANNKLYPRIG